MQELARRLRVDLRKIGEFKRVHPMPCSSADVPDDLDARLVVLSVDHPYFKDPDNDAEKAAKKRFLKPAATPHASIETRLFF